MMEGCPTGRAEQGRVRTTRQVYDNQKGFEDSSLCEHLDNSCPTLLLEESEMGRTTT